MTSTCSTESIQTPLINDERNLCFEDAEHLFRALPLEKLLTFRIVSQYAVLNRDK